MTLIHKVTLFLAVALVFLVLNATRVLAQFEEYHHAELDWRTIETTHFYIHFHDGAERTAQLVAKIAEEIYEPITSIYNHRPDGKVSFVIKDYDDYSNGAAYFYDNKVEIWASSLDSDLRGTHNWLRNVITHEFTHIVQMQTAFKFGRKMPGFYLQWLGYESERRTDVLHGYPNVIVSYPFSGFVVPTWFAEGVAQYNRPELSYDFWDTHRDMILRMYALDDRMLTWGEMSVFGKTSLGNESSYNAGFAFVRYLSDRFGHGIVADISRNLSSLSTVSIDGAIERATGKNATALYNEWREFLKTDYARRTAALREHTTNDTVIAGVGFGNFYPKFAPDGRSIAYVSTKEGDYFSQSSLYRYEVESKTEKLLRAGVRSNISWSPDGTRIYYSRTSKRNPNWSDLFDIYYYDLAADREERLTHGLRANAPSVSPDGREIAYVAGSDGTLNVFVMDIDAGMQRQLTHYQRGEQVYNPVWSPDGQTIVFEYSIKDGRDIARVSASGGEVQFLLATPDDERNPSFEPNGSGIVFSSDKSGIFNLYRYDLTSATITQLSNVLGGAFMPNARADGAIAYATYTSTGYKLALIGAPQAITNAPSYERAPAPVSSSGVQLVSVSDAAGSDHAPLSDLQRIRTYDDSSTPEYSSRPYSPTTSGLSIVPFLRVDNYNPKNKGIDVIKPGAYLSSFDAIDRLGFIASAAFNRKGERDLFFQFNYFGRVPGLYQLGLNPGVSIEAYNITRSADSYVPLPLDTIPVGVTYNLVEFDVALGWKVLTEALDAELRYAHSRYSATIDGFLLPELGQLVPAFSDLYFIGNDLSLTLKLDALARSRTMDINPIGRVVRARYDYEFSKFNATSDFEVKDGILVGVFQRPRFHRVEFKWREHQPLPGWTHTLSLQLHGGSILGAPVDDFFDFYIGGLAGMKGYPFYSLGGNEFATANLTYRFPLFNRIDLRVLQLYFDKLYAAVYTDAGSAWTGGSASRQQFRRDAGIELRLEAFSYYQYPTRIFFNATYGFDRFDRTIRNSGSTVTYGREWNFHFGVLFGFDLDS
jgi:sugar lactone lactonase YvrE